MIHIKKTAKSISVYVEHLLLHRYLHCEIHIDDLSILIRRKKTFALLADFPRTNCYITYE